MTDVVLGKWRCREGVLNEGWVVERMDFTNPLLQLYGLDQRAAIAYTDALNHADAAVSDVAQHIRQNATFYSFRPGESPHIERPLAAEHNDGGSGMSNAKTAQEVARELWAKDPLDFGSIHFGNVPHRERLSLADMVALANEAKRCADARYGPLARAVKALKKAQNELVWLKIKRPRATEAEINLAENAATEAMDDLCALGGYE